jgi:hypothetical protein
VEVDVNNPTTKEIKEMARKKIIDHVLVMKAAINQPGAAGLAAAKANSDLAIKAVTGGIKHPDWRTYMEQYCRGDDGQVDQEQLDRLLAVDGTDQNQALIDNRAYLVSNGVCGQGTRARFEENVVTIDQGLEENCNPTA